MKAIDALFRFILGCVFLFSGYVKAVDPLGMYYKIGDYLIAYDLTILEPLAMFAAISVIAVELVLGFFFLLNIFPKISIWAMLLVEGFFTILTYLSWHTNAVSDCGCFGDAIELSNAETFWKNVIMMVFVIWLFLRRNRLQAWFVKGVQFTLALSFIVFSLGFQWHNYNHLPIHDFRPYAIDTDIKTQMQLPEDAKQDVFSTKLYYEKDGVVKEFSEDNYPWQDSTWVFKDTKVELLEKGDEAPIHDFSILTESGDDVLPIILDDPNYKILVVSYNLERASISGFQKTLPILHWCAGAGLNVYPLTASGAEEKKKLNRAILRKLKFHSTDQTTLKTIVRSNPGILLLHGSKIVNKWHYNDMPTLDEFKLIVNK